MRRLIRALAVALVSSPAAAHGGHEHSIGWTLSPEVTVPLGLTLGVYVAGFLRLRHRSDRGRRALGRSAAMFLAGWAILAGALVSPLHEAGEVSFTMHMIEHELMMLPAALLLVAARPGPVLLWGLPRPARQFLAPILRLPLWRGLGAPLTATTLQSVALVAWHVPAMFDQTLRYDAWHIAQHASFIASALVFWCAMLEQRRGREGYFVASICLFATSLVGGGLGALMALDASPWYAGYVEMGMTPFGLSPAEDQQLAGVIMWVPGGLFHLAAALMFLARGLAPERLNDRIPRGNETA